MFFLILRHAKINANKNPTANNDGIIHRTWFVDVDVWAENFFKSLLLNLEHANERRQVPVGTI